MPTRKTSVAGRRRQAPAHARRWLWLGGALALVVALLIAIPLTRPQGPAVPTDPDAAARLLPEEARRTLPDEGRQHVPEGQRVHYGTDPPTSGPHWDRWAQPRLYEEPVPYELLVHNLEHGHVVVYYDPQRTPQEALAHLRRLTARHAAMWDAVVAVPRQDPRYVLILTAWRHWLHLERYDPALVDAFVHAYRGRGPENPVR